MKQRKRQTRKERQSKAYQYKRLPDEKTSIRLLELLPGRWDDEIRCNLHVRTSRPFPPYEAISYCWYDANDKDVILCNGKRLLIPWNLRYALHQLRSTTESRIMWADAICINQQNKKERGHQVVQMGTIFEEASTVLVWLGRGTGFSARSAFELIAFLETEFSLHPSDHDEEDLNRIFRKCPRKSWAELDELLCYEWFKRTWVVQEVGLAASALVVCGDATIDWNIFANVTSSLADHQKPWRQSKLLTGDRTLWRISNMLDLEFQDFSGMNILRVLDRGRESFASTDARDQVYAFLGRPAFREICQHHQRESFVRIDYSIPHGNVYLDVASQLTKQQDPLEFLSYVYHGKKLGNSTENFISWVPQWEYSARESPNILPCWSKRMWTGKFRIAQFGINERSFCIHGAVLDSLKYMYDLRVHASKPGFENWTAPVLDALIEPYELAKAWNDLPKALPDKSKENIFGELCDTITVGSAKKFRGGETEQLETLYLYMVAVGIPIKRNDIFPEQSFFGGDFWKLRLATSRIFRRHFFVTEGGHMGLGPECVLPGDMICTFFGGCRLFAIRPHPQGGGKYWFLGECYMRDIMNGEVEAMLDRGDIREETFHLV